MSINLLFLHDTKVHYYYTLYETLDSYMSYVVLVLSSFTIETDLVLTLIVLCRGFFLVSSTRILFQSKVIIPRFLPSFKVRLSYLISLS